jgi:alkane 1-monooxygenase
MNSLRIRSLKYALPLTIYTVAAYALTASGWQVWLPLLLVWVCIPLAELLLKPDARNLSAAEEELARDDRAYDLWLYLFVPLQYLAVWLFLQHITDATLTPTETTGRILVMALLCGSFGINIGHELGHRVSAAERFMAKALLLTSLYLHFHIEHNKGHHKRVSTPEDPSSARAGEPVYRFYIRTVVGSWLSAWEISRDELRKKGLPFLHPQNGMLLYQLVQLAFVAGIWLAFGGHATLCFVAAAAGGALLLETVNYIEHYGLQRRATAPGRYERAMPWHSWNSNHVLGRIVLFELSRHSDHHYQASRKYQVLRHHGEAPQMPTGYPGMMILSLLPPLWFRVMDPRVRALQNRGEHSPD